MRIVIEMLQKFFNDEIDFLKTLNYIKKENLNGVTRKAKPRVGKTKITNHEKN
ncbi:MAG: hypothetical protein H7250_10385 [Flavobacterium sp.]|nr:hypothetical protein [Flavobacterium sp.]